MSKQNRKQFREQVFSRDNNTCLVPWCEKDAFDAHHIIERELWDDGGYIKDNGASVCSKHHKAAEENYIPPQSFWMWANIEKPVTPKWSEKQTEKMLTTWTWFDSVSELTGTWNVNKWGEPFERPHREHLRDITKYQSSRHLLPLYWYDKTDAEERIENDDTGLESVEDFVGVPLVITQKIDGGNCMLVNDVDNPVRARRGSGPEKNGTMEPLYKQEGLYWQQEVNQKLPDRLQVFGEWVWAKHSIHYGCDCDDPCDDIGPSLSELTGCDDERAYFQTFGVYDKKFNIWLSWDKTKEVSELLGFPTVPVIYEETKEDEATFTSKHEARQQLISYAHDVIENGGEGIVVRKKYPFHYGQFGRSLGKYVRENHVKKDEKHWSKRKTIKNVL